MTIKLTRCDMVRQILPLFKGEKFTAKQVFQTCQLKGVEITTSDVSSRLTLMRRRGELNRTGGLSSAVYKVIQLQPVTLPKVVVVKAEKPLPKMEDAWRKWKDSEAPSILKNSFVDYCSKDAYGLIEKEPTFCNA